MHPLIRTAARPGFLSRPAITGCSVVSPVAALRVRRSRCDAGPNLVDKPVVARAVSHWSFSSCSPCARRVWFTACSGPRPSCASGIAAFGLVNAVTVLVSAALLATAVEVALDPIGDAATTVQLLYLVSGNLWGVGALFFGLWLIPMGSCVLRSGWMPRPLGWVLVSGGIGYVLSAFIRYLAPDAQVVADVLAYPATVGGSGSSSICWPSASAAAHSTKRRETPARLHRRRPEERRVRSFGCISHF